MNAHSPLSRLVNKAGLAKPDQESPDMADSARKDHIGTYPRDVDVHNNRFTRVARNMRVQHIIIGTLLVLNVTQAATIMQLLPLYKVVPVMITVSDKEEQVVRVQPMSDSIAAVNILIEQEVRQYVKERHTISQDDFVNLNRWGLAVKNTSTEDVFEGFIKETKPVVESAKAGKFTRSITLDSVQRVSDGQTQAGSIWRVDFTAYDRVIGQGLADTQENRRSFSVEMRVMLLPKRITYSQRFVNPLGFTVMSYSVVPRRVASSGQ